MNRMAEEVQEEEFVFDDESESEEEEVVEADENPEHFVSPHDLLSLFVPAQSSLSELAASGGGRPSSSSGNLNPLSRTMRVIRGDSVGGFDAPASTSAPRSRAGSLSHIIRSPHSSPGGTPLLSRDGGHGPARAARAMSRADPRSAVRVHPVATASAVLPPTSASTTAGLPWPAANLDTTIPLGAADLDDDSSDELETMPSLDEVNKEIEKLRMRDNPYGALPTASAAASLHKKHGLSNRPSAKDIFATIGGRTSRDDGEGSEGGLPVFESTPEVPQSPNAQVFRVKSEPALAAADGSFVVRGRRGQEVLVREFCVTLAEAASLQDIVQLLNHRDPATREHAAHVVNGMGLNSDGSHAVLSFSACGALKRLLDYGDTLVREAALHGAAVISRTPENQLTLIDVVGVAHVLNHMSRAFREEKGVHDDAAVLESLGSCAEFIANIATRAVGRKKLSKAGAGRLLCRSICELSSFEGHELLARVQELYATAFASIVMDAECVHDQISSASVMVVGVEWLLHHTDDNVREAAAVSIANLSSACIIDPRVRDLLISSGAMDSLLVIVIDGIPKGCPLQAGGFYAKAAAMSLASIANGSSESQRRLFDYHSKDPKVSPVMDHIVALGNQARACGDLETLLGALMLVNNVCDSDRGKAVLTGIQALPELLRASQLLQDADVRREGEEIIASLGRSFAGLEFAERALTISKPGESPRRNTIGRRISESKLVDGASEKAVLAALQELGQAAARHTKRIERGDSVELEVLDQFKAAAQNLRELCCPGTIAENCRSVVSLGGIEMMIDALESCFKRFKPVSRKITKSSVVSEIPEEIDVNQHIGEEVEADPQLAIAVDIMKALKYCGRVEPEKAFRDRQLVVLLLLAIEENSAFGVDQVNSSLYNSFIIAALDLVVALAYTLSKRHGSAEKGAGPSPKVLATTVAPLVKLIKYSHFVKTRQRAVRCVAVLASSNKKLQAAVGKSGAVTEILQCVKKVTGAGQSVVNAKPGLDLETKHTSMALHGQNDVVTMAAGSLAPGRVVHEDFATGEDLLLIHSLRAVKVFSQDSHNHDRLRKGGIAAALTRILNNLVFRGDNIVWSAEAKEIAAAASSAGSQLCSHADRVQDDFRRADAFTPLSQICSSTRDPVVTFHVTSFILELVKNSSRNKDAFILAGGVPAILTLVDSQIRDSPRSPILLNLLGIVYWTCRGSTKRKQRWMANDGTSKLRTLVDRWYQSQREKSATNAPLSRKMTETELQVDRAAKSTFHELR